MVLISFEELWKIPIFPKFQGCSSKIVPAMPIKSSILKWAWQAWFFSHAPGILEKCVFFKDLQIILVPFFYILTGIRFRKNTLKSDVHSLRRPWINLLTRVGGAQSLLGFNKEKFEMFLTRISQVSYMRFIFHAQKFSIG